MRFQASGRPGSNNLSHLEDSFVLLFYPSLMVKRRSGAYACIVYKREFFLFFEVKVDKEGWKLDGANSCAGI